MKPLRSAGLPSPTAGCVPMAMQNGKEAEVQVSLHLPAWNLSGYLSHPSLIHRPCDRMHWHINVTFLLIVAHASNALSQVIYVTAPVPEITESSVFKVTTSFLTFRYSGLCLSTHSVKEVWRN